MQIGGKMEKKLFEELFAINVNEHTEKRDNGKVELTYLSWSWAWAEFKKKCPNAKYEIKMFNGLPYVFDEKTGYMVFTSVTVEDITHDMWLPVMDSNNKAMKNEKYSYFVKKRDSKTGKETTIEKFVATATMFDINKTIMRCLVKNLAMFGLGLYIYSGEDLPEQEQKEETPEKAEQKTEEIKLATKEQIEELKSLSYKGTKPLEELTFEQAEKYIKMGKEMKAKFKKK